MLACLLELTDRGQRMWLSRHSRRGARLPRPLNVPRPCPPGTPRPEVEVIDDRPKAASAADLRRFFG